MTNRESARISTTVWLAKRDDSDSSSDENGPAKKQPPPNPSPDVTQQIDDYDVAFGIQEEEQNK